MAAQKPKKKADWQIGKHLEVIPLWHGRRYQGVLVVGRHYEITGCPDRLHYEIDLGQQRYIIQRTHTRLVDAEYSGEL